MPPVRSAPERHSPNRGYFMMETLIRDEIKPRCKPETQDLTFKPATSRSRTSQVGYVLRFRRTGKPDTGSPVMNRPSGCVLIGAAHGPYEPAELLTCLRSSKAYGRG